MCAMCECGVDTQRLSIPSTTVATRKAIALYQSRSVVDVQAAQAQHCGLKTNATVLTTYFTVNETGESECRKRSAVRAVWVFFTSHSSIRLWRIIRGTPTFGPKQSWIYSSTATSCPTTNSSTSHPFETTTMKMGLLSARDSLLFTFFDNLHGQLILRVLLYWKSVFFSLLDFQSYSMYLFTQQEWLVAHRVLHVGVPAWPLCVSLLGHLLVVCFIFLPDDLRNRRSRSSLHMGVLDQRFLFEHIFDDDLASLPNTCALERTLVDFLD